MAEQRFNGNVARIAYYFYRIDKEKYFAVYDFGSYLYEKECAADEVDFSKCREYTYEDYKNSIE